MKIFINRKPVEGPWGGGSKILGSLIDEFRHRGHDVVFNLVDDIGLIFCFDPRSHEGISYEDLVCYRDKKRCKIIQRVGDVGSHSKPELTSLVKKTVDESDVVVFTSNWAKRQIVPKNKNVHIISNAPLDIFYSKRRDNSLPQKVIRIVTHHWSSNPLKGFDVYSHLGKLINEKIITNIEFTYVGRYSENHSHDGITLVSPKNSKELSCILPTHDIYLTASLWEAGANHVLEAMAAGLPILYRREGGSINEYCDGYGIEYDNNLQSLIDTINIMVDDYVSYSEKTKGYTRTIGDVVGNYVDVIQHVCNGRF